MTVLPFPHDELTALRQENATLTQEIATLKDVLQARAAAKELERFHLLDGLKDNICPCCGAAVNVVDNGYGTGVKIESRW